MIKVKFLAWLGSKLYDLSSYVYSCMNTSARKVIKNKQHHFIELSMKQTIPIEDWRQLEEDIRFLKLYTF